MIGERDKDKFQVIKLVYDQKVWENLKIKKENCGTKNGMKDLTQKQTHGIQFSTPWIDRYYRGWGGGPQPFLGSITLFPFKYLSSPILSLFLPLMVMPKVVLKNSGQKLCFFAHLALYLQNAIKHLVSRVLRDSIPSFVHPSVGRSFGRLVGPHFTFWHFCRHGWVN